MECNIEECQILKLKKDLSLEVGDFDSYQKWLSDAVSKKYFTNSVVVCRDSDGSGFGSVFVRGVFVCDSLENPDYLIPSGRYMMRYSHSPRFKKSTYELIDVPERSGIRLHSGNYVYHSKGCILLGEKSGNSLQHSVATVDRFEKVCSSFMLNQICVF